MTTSTSTSTSASSESSFFIEYNQILDLIALFPTTNSSTTDAATENTNNAYNNDDDQVNNNNQQHDIHQQNKIIQNGNQALAKLKLIFDKYLECPTLLDSKLEHILLLLSKQSITIIHELHSFLLSQPTASCMNVDIMNIDDDDDDDDDQQYQEYEEYKYKIIILKRYFSAIYTICKVRGHKHISKYLSHEAKDVEPVLYILHHIRDIQQHQSSHHNGEIEIAENWEAVYVLLLWLGMLSLVPFDLNTIDSSLNNIINNNTKTKAATAAATTNNNHTTTKPTTLISSMITTIQQHLSDAGPTRIIASSSLAKLFSRPDLEEKELHSFVLFSNDVLKSFLSSSSSSSNTAATTATTATTSSSPATSIFLVMGIFQTLANVFKNGNRSTLMQRHLSSIEILWENAILLSEQCSLSFTNNNSNSTNSSISSSSTSLVLRKFLVKLFARVGCSYLPPRIAKWRYQRGKRSLLENLSNSNNNNTSIASDENPKKDEINNIDCEDIDDLFDVPDQVEDSMAQLIQSLTDPATTVRWSAAKGIGRLTERLPIVCADDVLDAIMELCNNEQNYENDNVWHGSCLTLAELARRGLLLPDRLEEVIPIVIKAIQYDVPRGSHSVGSHVRDAACYVCWAFARAYAPSILQPYVQDLSKAIVIASLFDREINCRRAASASFQECVGRQGADNFKHGIAILTAADYFTIGNRVEAFTTVAKKIAVFKEYRYSLINHLYEEKLFHWDVDIRKLSALSLRMLTTLDPEHFVNVVIPYLLPLCTNDTLFVRHGALLGVSEIILALGTKLDDETCDSNRNNYMNMISDDLKDTISDLVFQIEKARLYRGRGGEIMRSAVSRFIECIAKANIPLTVKKQVGLLDSLDANLRHPNEDIQKGAAAALSALMITYFPVGPNGPSERLQNRVVKTYIKLLKEEENPAATRGYALAIGSLPAKLIAHNIETLDTVIDCLTYASHHDSKVGQQGDAETRRNAIESLVNVCETVGVEKEVQHEMFPVVGMNKEQIEKVFECLLSCMNDYNTDRRGDVGSWSRIAAMKGLVTITFLSVKSSNLPQHSIKSSSHCSKKSLSMIPTYSDRIFTAFEQDVESKVKICIKEQKPYRQYKQLNMLDKIYFDDQLCSKVLGAILKQLAEKLDTVRLQAGLWFEHLVMGTNSIPFIPSKDLVLEAVEWENGSVPCDSKESAMNWGNPEITFPILMRLVNIDAFFHSIINGIVISIGGLTESITKHSTKSFLDYLRALQKAERIGRISKIGKGKFSLH